MVTRATMAECDASTAGGIFDDAAFDGILEMAMADGADGNRNLVAAPTQLKAGEPLTEIARVSARRTVLV